MITGNFLQKAIISRLYNKNFSIDANLTKEQLAFLSDIKKAFNHLKDSYYTDFDNGFSVVEIIRRMTKHQHQMMDNFLYQNTIDVWKNVFMQKFRSDWKHNWNLLDETEFYLRIPLSESLNVINKIDMFAKIFEIYKESHKQQLVGLLAPISYKHNPTLLKDLVKSYKTLNSDDFKADLSKLYFKSIKEVGYCYCIYRIGDIEEDFLPTKIELAGYVKN